MKSLHVTMQMEIVAHIHKAATVQSVSQQSYVAHSALTVVTTIQFVAIVTALNVE